MNLNERPSDRRSVHAAEANPRPEVSEQTLCTGHVQIERKSFVFALKQNPRGRFLRITEDAQGRRERIIIPAPGLEEFRKALDDMVKASADAVPPAESDGTPGAS